jgi:uncharacterized protein
MKEKVIEFLRFTQFYEMVEETIGTLIENSDELDDVMKTKLEDAMDLSELESAIVPLYEKMFTESELDTILEFFETPAGKKMLLVNDTISGEVNQIFHEWLTTKYNTVIG